MRTPVLETDRLILRPFKEDDVTDVFECWESDPDVAKYMFWTSHNDIEKTREWITFELGQIEKQDWYRFAIVLKDTNILIGTALVYYEEEVECWEIGYNLGKKYWGKGYTTEAMKRVIEFATEELKLLQIVGRYAKENPASGNVMRKLGFKYEKDIPYECNNGAVKREGIQCRLYNQMLQLAKGSVEMIIKKAELKDLQEILDLQYMAYQSEAELFNDHDIPPLKQTLEDVLVEYQNGIILKVLDADNVIVGSVRANLIEGTVYIGKLIVHPKKQGQGIGTKLLQTVEAKYPGLRYELFTSNRSVRNIALYQRLGYKIFSQKKIIEEMDFVYLEKC